MQAVIVETALMTSPLDEGWRRNGAGKWFNQKFGFGRMDASQLIEKAKNWDNISEQKKCWATKNVGPWYVELFFGYNKRHIGWLLPIFQFILVA